jgi:hypothetical protein
MQHPPHQVSGHRSRNPHNRYATHRENDRNLPCRRGFLTLNPGTISINSAEEAAEISVLFARTDDARNGSGLSRFQAPKRGFSRAYKAVKSSGECCGPDAASSCHPLLSLHFLAGGSSARPLLRICWIGGHTVVGQSRFIARDSGSPCADQRTSAAPPVASLRAESHMMGRTKSLNETYYPETELGGRADEEVVPPDKTTWFARKQRIQAITEQ